MKETIENYIEGLIGATTGTLQVVISDEGVMEMINSEDGTTTYFDIVVDGGTIEL